MPIADCQLPIANCRLPICDLRFKAGPPPGFLAQPRFAGEPVSKERVTSEQLAIGNWQLAIGNRPTALWTLNFELRALHFPAVANDTLSKLKRIQQQAQAFFEERGIGHQDDAQRGWWHRFAHFWLLVGKSFVRNRCPVRASALAYTTLLALIPLLAVGVSITTSLLQKQGEKPVREMIDKLVANESRRHRSDEQSPGSGHPDHRFHRQHPERHPRSEQHHRVGVRGHRPAPHHRGGVQ
ncbi:MAG: hypothetical protein DME25_17310 [Verrucomicrobia bacterium]|nr:MAG: hypothetical protein DME25_17310 [Verrucomicrobiota bacterium]